MCRLAALVFAGFLSSICLAAPVPAGKSSGIPTELPIPAKSVVIVQQNDYPKLVGSFQSMMKASFGKDGDKLWEKLNEADKADGSNGLQWKSVTKGERTYFAVMSFEFDADEPPFVASIPVDDVKTFRESIFPKDTIESTEKLDGYEKITTKDSGDFYWLDKKGRVYLCGSKEIAEEMKKSYEPFKTKQLGESAASFFENDLSVYVSIDAVRETFDEQIKQFRGLLPLIMQQVDGQLDKQQIEAAKAMIELVFQLLDDGKGVTLGMSFKQDGVALKLHAAFTPNSPMAKVTAAEKPNSLAAAGKLPAGFTIYTASALSPKIGQAFARLYREFAPADGDDAGKKALDDWQAIASQASKSGLAMNIDRSGLTAIEHADADKTVAAMISAIKASGDGLKYQNIPIKGKPALKENDQTFQGIAMHRIAMTFDFEAFGKGQPEATREATIASVKKLLPETMTMWVGGKGDQIVQVSGKDWDAAKAILEKTFAGKDVIGASEAAKSTRSALPAETCGLTLLEGGQIVNFIGEYAKTMLGAMPGLPFDGENVKIAKVTGDPAYLGAAFTMSGNTASVDLFIPHRVFGQVYQAVKPMLDGGN